MYSEKVIEHFKNPYNQGKISNPDATGEKGNPVCGDVMKIYLKIKQQSENNKREDIIEDIKFETFGCAAAIAVTSSLTDMVKGKTLEEASSISKDEITESLDGLPAPKIHCSMLGVDALQEAISKYYNQR